MGAAMRLGAAIGAAVAVVVLAGASRAHAEDEPEAFARVIVDEAELRTGPGISYRVLHVAHRGETFALDGRPGAGFWLKVLLPDGRVAYALGDQVQPFSVRPGEEGAPSRPGFFAPPPLEGARGGLSLVGGMLSVPVADGSIKAFGYVEARPSLVVHKTVSLEGFLGDGLTSDGAQVLYGGGVNVNLAPTWVICPFVGAYGGGLTVVPNSDSFVLKRRDFLLARVGGGFMFALKNRILVRLEVTNISLFTADSYRNAQTYSGGLGVYF